AALIREAPAQLASEPGDLPPAAQNGAGPATRAEPATLAGMPVQITAPAHRPLLWDRLRPGRGVVLAVAGAAAVAGLTGWLLGGAVGARPQPPPRGAQPAPSAAARPGVVDARDPAGPPASGVSPRPRPGRR